MAIGKAITRILILVIISVVIGATASVVIQSVTNVNLTGVSPVVAGLWFLVPMGLVFAFIFIIFEAAGIPIFQDS